MIGAGLLVHCIYNLQTAHARQLLSGRTYAQLTVLSFAEAQPKSDIIL
jgi:hypothetical protein